MKITLSHEELLNSIDYDPKTGIFSNKNGKRIGSKSGLYRRLCINRMYAREHRVAWFYMTGKWPKMIDHINGDKTDNRFDNLRECNQSQNLQNQYKAHPNSKTGLLGVEVNGNRFCARIRTKSGREHLGSFATPQEAHEAYLKRKREIHEFCEI